MNKIQLYLTKIKKLRIQDNKILPLFLFFLILLLCSSCSLNKNLSTSSIGITVKGKIILEESDDYSDIHIGVWGYNGIHRRPNEDGTFSETDFPYGSYYLCLYKEGWYRSFYPIIEAEIGETIDIGSISMYKMHYDLKADRLSSKYKIKVEWDWKDSLENCVGFNIHRLEVETRKINVLNTEPVTGSIYIDNAPDIEKSYDYWLTAIIKTPSSNYETGPTSVANVPSINIDEELFSIPEFNWGAVYIHYQSSDAIYIIPEDKFEVYQYDKNGNLIQTIVSPDKPDGNYANNKYFAVANDRSLFITSTYLDRIEKYNSDGDFIESISTINNQQLNNPEYIAIDKDNNIYLHEESKDYVNKLNSLGELISTFSIGSKYYFHPSNTILYDGAFYILINQAEIQKYSLLGELLDTINLKEPELFGISASGLRLDDDYFYAFDWKHIYIYDTKGNYLTSVRNEEFDITDIAIGSSHQLFVVNGASGKLSVISWL